MTATQTARNGEQTRAFVTPWHGLVEAVRDVVEEDEEVDARSCSIPCLSDVAMLFIGWYISVVAPPPTYCRYSEVKSRGRNTNLVLDVVILCTQDC